MSYITNGVATVLPAPKGYVVDFDNPQRNGDITTYWVTGVGLTLSTFFMCQHLYMNTFVRRNIGLGDACLVAAYIFLVTIQALIVRAFARKFLGVHAWEMPYTKFEEFVRFNVYLNPIIYAPPSALAKMVILLLYLQLGNSSKWFKYSIYITMAVNIGSNTGIFFSSIFACRPIAKGWDLNITGGSCINREALFESTAVLNIVTDILTIAIPLPMVKRLQMSRKKKAGLLGMFAIGSATVTTSFIRLVLLITVLGKTDQPWGGGPVSIWVAVEANLLIICGSLPTLRPFFKPVALGLTSTNGGRSKKTGVSGGIVRNRTAVGTSRCKRGLQTLESGAGKGDEYGGFAREEPFGMKTLVVGGRGQKEDLEAEGSRETVMGSREWGFYEDGGSDKGIVQTTTTKITYST